MVAPMVLYGPVGGDRFEAYIGQVLVPERKSGDVVCPTTSAPVSAR